MHQLSVSWDKNLLYFFNWKFYILSGKAAFQYTNLVKFYVSKGKSKILHFDGFLLSKLYKASNQKVQKSYLSWHSRVMQSLKKSLLVVSNMKWKIWRIFTKPFKALKIYFRWAFFVKSRQGLSHKNKEE